VTKTARHAEDESAIAGLRSRRCIVTGDVYPEGRLLRFAIAPDGAVVPDIEAKLPGRGIWVRADKEAVDTAVKKRLFARAAKSEVKAGEDLSGLAETLLVQRLLSLIGLARRSGQLILGFDQVERALSSDDPPALVIEAVEASPGGAGKLKSAAIAQGITPYVICFLSIEEMSLAVGRENVVHAALRAGHMAERMIFEAARLEGFRTNKTWIWPGYAEPAGLSGSSAPLAC
jgi:uncharacterized protein